MRSLTDDGGAGRSLDAAPDLRQAAPESEGAPGGRTRRTSMKRRPPGGRPASSTDPRVSGIAMNSSRAGRGRARDGIASVPAGDVPGTGCRPAFRRPSSSRHPVRRRAVTPRPPPPAPRLAACRRRDPAPPAARMIIPLLHEPIHEAGGNPAARKSASARCACERYRRPDPLHDEHVETASSSARSPRRACAVDDQLGDERVVVREITQSA